MTITFEETTLSGVLLIKPKVYGDHRGFFLEICRTEEYAAVGISLPFVQDNHSRSTRGILRGMHYQFPNTQGKLVFVTRGKVFDVAVDIRRSSPNFGHWFGTVLDDENHNQLWIPPGFAHGFCVLSDVADFMYKCTEIYHPEQDAGFLWNDPDVAIQWPLEGEPILSEKDKKSRPRLRNIAPERLPF